MELVVSKTSAYSSSVCEWYTVPVNKDANFKLETCDAKCVCHIYDTAGREMARLALGDEAFLLTEQGRYKVCIKGTNTRGSVYVELLPKGGESCCTELREKCAELEARINAKPSQDSKTAIVAGDNVTVTSSIFGDTTTYRISAINSGSGSDVTREYVDQQTNAARTNAVAESRSYTDRKAEDAEDYADARKAEAVGESRTYTDSKIPVISAGTGISVSRSGNEYTISATGGTVDPAWFSTLSAGSNVLVVPATMPDGHIDYNISAVVPDVSGLAAKSYVDERDEQVLADAEAYTDSKVTPHSTVTAGQNITVVPGTGASGATDYMVSAPNMATMADVDAAEQSAITDANTYTDTQIGILAARVTVAEVDAGQHSTVVAGQGIAVGESVNADGGKQYTIINVGGGSTGTAVNVVPGDTSINVASATDASTGVTTFTLTVPTQTSNFQGEGDSNVTVTIEP